MADSTNNGQMDFSTDLSALNQFIQTIQEFKNQLNSTSPEMKNVTALFNDLNKSIKIVDSTLKSFSDQSQVSASVQSMISVIDTLKLSFNAIGKSSNSISKFMNNIDNMAGAINRLNALSSEFSAVKDTVKNASKIGDNRLITFFTQLETVITQVLNSFNSLSKVTTNLDDINNLINELVDTFNKLNNLSTSFSEILDNAKTPANLQETERSFKEIITLVERLNILYNGLSGSVGGMDVLNSGLKTLDTVMESLVSTTSQFNELIDQVSNSSTITTNVTPYFENLINTVNQINTSFKNVLTSSDSLVEIENRFKSIQNAMSSLLGISNNLDSLLEKTFDIPDISDLKAQFASIAQVVQSLSSEFKNIGASEKDLKQISSTLRSISEFTKNLEKVKILDADDLIALNERFLALIEIVKQFISEINKIDTANTTFANLGNVLKGLNSTLKNTTASGTQMNKTLNDSKNKIITLQGATKDANSVLSGTGNRFDNAFGSNPLNMLNRLQGGINSVRHSIQGLFITMGGKALWDWVIGTNQQIEVLQSSLEVTLKSAEAAEEAIIRLRSYAALTHFSDLETYQAGEMFASNRMDIDKWVRVAGDLASAKKTAGVELGDVVRVLTRINSGDFGKAMIRLRQMGISLNDLRDKGLEFTSNSTFKGDTQEMLSALEQIINERYGGLTQQLGQTTDGLLETIKDFIQQLGIELGSESFDKLRDWLKTLKYDIMEFQDSIEFREIIKDFNVFINGMIKFLQPFGKALATLGKILVNNLPLIGNLLQLFLKLQAVKFGINIFQGAMQGLANMTNNWALINKQADLQTAKLKEQGVELRKQSIELAKQNALRKAGKKYLSEDQMSKLMQRELAAVGGVTGTEMLKGSKLSGIAAGVAAIGPVVLGIVAGAQIISSVFDSLASSMKKSKTDLSATVKDYDRIIGQEIEEVESLQKLNSTRITVNESLKYYTDLQQRANATTSEEIWTNEMRADISNKLNDSKNHLIRLNEQIIHQSPELAGELSNETGELTDQTGAFELNTLAILDNIEARKIAIDEKHRDQVISAKLQKELLQEELNRNAKVMDAANDQSFFTKTITGIGGLLKLGLNVGGAITLGDSFFSLIDSVFNADGATEAMDLNWKSEKAREKAQIQKDLRNIEINQEIKELDKKIAEEDEAIKMGHVDEYGNVEWDKYYKEKEEIQNTLNSLQKRSEATPQRFIEEVEKTEAKLDKIAKDYELLLKEELLKNGNDTETNAYKEIEQAKVAVIEKTIDESIAGITDIYNIAKAGWEIQTGRVHESLKFLLDSELNPSEIVTALKGGNDRILDLYDGRQEIIDNLLNFYNYMIKNNIKAEDIKAVASNYELAKLSEEAAQDAIKALKLERTEAALSLIQKSSRSKRSPLQEFNDKWNQEKSQVSLRKDITLQRDLLAGHSEDSAIYRAHEKQQTNLVVSFITRQISALKEALNTNIISDAKERYQAQTQLLQLDKERNQLLLDIKKNTTKLDEFNKPSIVRAITYYDYMSKDADKQTIEIGDARFVMQIQSIQTLDDARKMMEVIKKYLGEYIKQSESSGYANPNSLI